MAPISLWKTADANQEKYPEAAETLSENTYMDDKCKSVHTKEKAKEMIKELDKVLNSGGFHVKGWISIKSITAL